MRGRIGILWGLLLGLIAPLIPYFIINGIIWSKGGELDEDLNAKMLTLFIMLDMFLVQFFFKRDLDYAGRGVLLAMFCLAAYCVINFVI